MYQHFCMRLQAIVRQRIPVSIRKAYDDDDASVSAFHSLFLGIRERRYQFDDRADFWRLLLTIAERKIAKRVRYETRDKRDVRRLVQNSMFVKLPTERSDAAQALVGYEPTPALAAEVSETCEQLLASLPDDTSRKIALLKLQSYTSDEIAEQLGCTRRTVQRKLLVIRRTWQHAGGLEVEAQDMSQSGDQRVLE